jgi:hypothetical protein
MTHCSLIELRNRGRFLLGETPFLVDFNCSRRTLEKCEVETEARQFQRIGVDEQKLGKRSFRQTSSVLDHRIPFRG